MFATAIQIDPALALAIGDAAPCDYQEHPSLPACGDRATWVAVMPCGCRHLACDRHKPAADAEMARSWFLILLSVAVGQPFIAACVECHRPIFDFTIVWEPI